MWFSLVFCLSLFIISNARRDEVINIGGLFEEGYRYLEYAFRLAIHKVNSDPNLLPNVKLRSIVSEGPIERDDAFFATMTVCQWMEQGLAAVFGPQTLRSVASVQSVLEPAGIPLIINRWEYRNLLSENTVFIHPHADTKGYAIRDFVKDRGWNKFAIIYEDPKALIRLSPFLANLKSNDTGDAESNHPEIHIKQIEDRSKYKKLFKDLKVENIKNFIIDIPTNQIQYVLLQAKEMLMLDIYHNYFFTSLDTQTVDFTPFYENRVNITMFRVIEPGKAEFNIHIKLKNDITTLKLGQQVEEHVNTTQFALMYDAVLHFAAALKNLGRNYYFKVQPNSCQSEKKWDQGQEIIKSMKNVTTPGLTGDITIDATGYRTDFQLTELRLVLNELKKEGYWNKTHKFTAIRNETAELDESEDILRGMHLRVSSVINKPYFMNHPNHTKEKPVYEGHSMDLVAKLAEVSNFTYTFHKVFDDQYGKFVNGEWNGMVGELIRGQADIVVADLTVTEKRNKAVDFTLPYMQLGIGILFKKPSKKDANLFSFLSPFSVQVWFYMATGILGVTIVMYVMGRFTPYEWENPHPCDTEPVELENQFTLQETTWLVVGCLMQQGGDITPRATSTRMAIGYWWFFTLIMVSSYTANLAAFLTAGRMETEIKSAEDLVNQQKIQYGCVDGGSTESFFKESTHSLYSRMWTNMESAEPKVFVKNNKKGEDRVLMGNYAFFMESTTIEYATADNCNLMKVGNELDKKSYAIALPKGSPIRESISRALLLLHEKGATKLLKAQWWQPKQDCPPDAPASDTLGLESIGGVFLILLIGLPIACLAVLYEYFWETRKTPKSQRGPLCMELYKELKLTVMGKNTVKMAPPEEDDEEKIVSSKPSNTSSTSSTKTSTPTK